jgi:hypothetical protein
LIMLLMKSSLMANAIKMCKCILYLNKNKYTFIE